jgi:hypothetical protein
MMAEEDEDFADEEGSSRGSESDDAMTDIASEGTVPSGDPPRLLTEFMPDIDDLSDNANPASCRRSQGSVAC